MRKTAENSLLLAMTFFHADWRYNALPSTPSAGSRTGPAREGGRLRPLPRPYAVPQPIAAFCMFITTLHTSTADLLHPTGQNTLHTGCGLLVDILDNTPPYGVIQHHRQGRGSHTLRDAHLAR